MTRKEKTGRLQNLFDGIFGHDSDEKDSHRVDAIETLRREVDADLFRDVIGDLEHA